LRSILSLPLAFAAWCGTTHGADADAETTPPMRLPNWIESIGQPTDDAAEGSSDILPVSGKEPGLLDEGIVVPAVGADHASDRSASAWRSPTAPSPPSASAPIIQTAGQQKPATQPKPQPKPQPQPQAAAPSGTVRRWISDRFASAPPETVPPPAADASPAQPAKEQPASVTAPIAATPDEMPTLSIDPASFRGAYPGKTGRAELEGSWGKGEPSEEGDPDTAVWKMEPFERVEVSFEGGKVAAIGIKLAAPMPLADLTKQLEITELRTVAIKDDAGQAIGEVFPERGVILSLEPGTTQANAILIEPLDADAFVLRAEGEIETCSAYAAADLKYALELDPQNLRAHQLLLGIACDQGQWNQALVLAESACRLAPDATWASLKLARVLLALDRPNDVRDVVARISKTSDTSPLVAAQCQRLLGRAALAGPTPDHRGAVEFFTEAIRLAAPLLSKKSPQLQAAVREVLLDAHLGTALAISQGTWQQKGRVIPKWIVRSEAVVKEFTGSDAERRVLEMQLCTGALAVAAGSTESIEPLPWVKRMLELRDAMGETVGDPWKRRQIDWQVGQGLSDALAAAQIRGDASDMLDNATLTAAYLERGGEQRELTSEERKQVGDLLFRIGILHSLQRGDHATAVTWFDRTIPLWTKNERFESDGELGRLGESYVSMAISYWQVDRRDDALELGSRGVDLMVKAVDKGQLEERALSVAYGNLSTMYAEQGDEAKSRNYAEMAARAEASSTTLR
jgi:tetratricopeptide (TPR) repeat protein